MCILLVTNIRITSFEWDMLFICLTQVPKEKQQASGICEDLIKNISHEKNNVTSIIITYSSNFKNVFISFPQTSLQ